MPGPYQAQADAQAEKDVLITKAVTEYFADHLDAYPAVLHLVFTVLEEGRNSSTNGQSEYNALTEILNTVRNYVRKDDPASIDLLFPTKD